MDLLGYDVTGSNQYYGGHNDAGENVSVTTGEKITTVFNSINVISQDMACLPFQVRQNTKENGKVNHSDHPITRLINHRPNPYMNAYQFKYAMTFMGESRGNGYAWIERDGNGTPTALYPMSPDEVKTMKDPETGAWFYKIRGVVFPSYNIFHYRTFTTDGFNGISKIVWNAQNIGLKMKTHKYKSHIIGKTPAGYLSAKALNSTQAGTVAEGWTQQIEGGKTPFLYGDVDYKHLMFSPEQTDIIASEKWTDTMTLGIYRMQPVMVSVHEDSNYSNAEQQNIIHAKYTLSAPIAAWEQEANTKLFSERNKTASAPFYTKININGLLRGDTTAQMEMIRTMVTLGIFNQNDVLGLMDMPKVDDGDDYYIQGAMIKKGTQPLPPTSRDRMNELDEQIRNWSLNGKELK